MPSFNFQSSHSTFALSRTAAPITEFFAGTTDETTTFCTCRRRKNPAITLLESSAVVTRTGVDTRWFDAYAIFA
jgi:hypothetical protein